LERYSGSIVCSKQLYKEALGHDYDEPKQWELREINDIMNNAVTGWRAFSNPRYFPEPYRRQKGWERIRNDNEPDNSMDGFQEIPTEEMEQLGLPEEWLKQK
jgi:virulence-associated E